MQIQELVFVGVKSHVLAIQKQTGQEVWQCKCKGGSTFVTLLVNGNYVYAHTGGELFCLEALSGRILWKNELKGMGYGLASIAMEGMSVSPTMVQQQADDAQRNSQNHQTGQTSFDH